MESLPASKIESLISCKQHVGLAGKLAIKIS
jgi:hypothetical protein